MAKHVLSDEEKERIERYKWLTDRQRYIYDLFYCRGWSVAEIVAALSDDSPESDWKGKKTDSASPVKRELRVLRRIARNEPYTSLK